MRFTINMLGLYKTSPRLLEDGHGEVVLRLALSRVIEDTQTFDGNTRAAVNEKFTSYPATQFAFPEGRQITNVFDPLYRRMQVGETGGSAIANWEFFRPRPGSRSQAGRSQQRREPLPD